MKYANEQPTTTKEKQLTIDDCIPGELYEFVYDGDPSKPRPALSNLRLCTKSGTSGITLHSLKNGSKNADSADRFRMSKYIHRPDIQLTIVED